MDILRFLRIAEATGVIFEHGIKPREQDFKEFTAEQYAAIARSHHNVTEGQKLYSWIPPKHAYSSRVVLTATEEHKQWLLEAARNIDLHAESRGLSYDNYTDKLRFAASIFPPELSEGTPFARPARSTVENPQKEQKPSRQKVKLRIVCVTDDSPTVEGRTLH